MASLPWKEFPVFTEVVIRWRDLDPFFHVNNAVYFNFLEEGRVAYMKKLPTFQKIARKYKLSNEFGVQLDSFADFLSFVLVPVFLIFQASYAPSLEGFGLILAAVVSVYYVISGLRRLIHFNLNADAGEVEKYFTGVPTPLGAILLWLVYLLNAYDILPAYGVMFLMLLIGWSLNSTIKVRHP